ncbi:hypothetical protein [Mycoplasma enhydrae]|uniref:hypothetical protein n=1 Tax=Mycoplasma enhydrae TaxID=2499220 RepID=UPI00197B9856|nr:hypothetical protein [Mycoplasma enhydrae]MBN4089220.1 hypothetical protein [Mycoplasma enhydrae]
MTNQSLKIEKIFTKLEQYNNQFYEVSKKEKKYKKLEMQMAELIVEITSYKDLFYKYFDQFKYEIANSPKNSIKLKEYNKLYEIFNNAKEQKTKIVKIFNKNNKWAQLESANITNVINFALKIKSAFSMMNNYLDNNEIKDFKYLKSRKINIQRKITKVINWFDEDKYLNISSKEIKKNKRNAINLIREYTIMITRGLKYYNFINQEIEDKIYYIATTYEKNKQKIRFLYTQKWIKGFCSEIKNKIKILKNQIANANVFSWKNIFEKDLINLSTRIEEVLINISKEVIAYQTIDNLRKSIIDLVDIMIQNHAELLKVKGNDLYKEEFDKFSKSDLPFFNFLRAKNWEEESKISFAIKLGELNFLLKKMYNLIFLQENLLNKQKISLDELITNIKKENTNIYKDHDFDFPITNDIHVLQKAYQKQLKNAKPLTKKSAQTLKLYNETIKWMIIILNAEIKVAKEMLEKYQYIIKDKQLDGDEYLVLNNLFYSHKYKEVIIKIIELKKKE